MAHKSLFLCRESDRFQPGRQCRSPVNPPCRSEFQQVPSVICWLHGSNVPNPRQQRHSVQPIPWLSFQTKAPLGFAAGAGESGRAARAAARFGSFANPGGAGMVSTEPGWSIAPLIWKRKFPFLPAPKLSPIFLFSRGSSPFPRADDFLSIEKGPVTLTVAPLVQPLKILPVRIDLLFGSEHPKRV